MGAVERLCAYERGVPLIAVALQNMTSIPYDVTAVLLLLYIRRHWVEALPIKPRRRNNGLPYRAGC